MDHYDGRDHEYCEQCGDCTLCDVPHDCARYQPMNPEVKALQSRNRKREQMPRPKLVLDANGVKRDAATGEVYFTEEEKEVRAILQARKERTEREKSCQQAIDKALTEFNCNLIPLFKTGENSTIPTQQIVTLPVVITIASR